MLASRCATSVQLFPHAAGVSTDPYGWQRLNHALVVPACAQSVTATTSSSHLNEAGLPPAVKFSLKNDLAPSAAGPQTYTFTMRIPASVGACASLQTLCGSGTCLTALADSNYRNCPAFNTAAPAQR
jgi:hypothetical protein